MLKQTLPVPARTALVHIEKGKKCFAQADVLIQEREEQIKRLESRGEDHFISAGKIFAQIKDDHDTKADGAWGSVCKKKCGLEQPQVDFYIAVSEGRKDARAYREATAARVRRIRVGKDSSGTNDRTTGKNSCNTDPRIEPRSLLLNQILEGVRLANVCAESDIAALFDFRPLADAAMQAAAKWQQVASNLRRKADDETNKKARAS